MREVAPGEATQVFIRTAGLVRRTHRHLVLAVTSSLFVVSLLVLLALDFTGVLVLSVMGAWYDATGFADPNAVRRVEVQLRDRDLTPAQKEALRKRLLALRAGVEAPRKSPARVKPPPGPEGARPATFVSSVFDDERKTAVAPRLEGPTRSDGGGARAGLGPEIISRVVADNSRSMTLCLQEAIKRGERHTGKMEVEVMITPDGRVSAARVLTRQFRATTLGKCTIRRVRGWRFPRFEGEPVSVVFPYVLSAGM